jgi:mannose-6-phosphate isomerase-like protein (cupin superfamily)
MRNTPTPPTCGEEIVSGDEAGSAPAVLRAEATLVDETGCTFTPLKAVGHGRPAFSVAEFTVPPGATSSPDRHAESEIWLVRDGHGEILLTGADPVPLEPGGGVCIAPDQEHRLRNTGVGTLRVFSIYW